jgi:hypothetical protein
LVVEFANVFRLGGQISGGFAISRKTSRSYSAAALTSPAKITSPGKEGRGTVACGIGEIRTDLTYNEIGWKERNTDLFMEDLGPLLASRA